MRNGKKWLRGGCRASIAALTMAACYYETPAPTQFNPAQIDDSTAVPFDRIRAYAATLRFDGELGAADSGFAPGGDPGLIEPEAGAWAVDSNELARGRIIARIQTRSVHPVEGYGPTWWTWWWVDKQGGRWRAFLLSDSLKTRVKDSVTRKRHPKGYQWRQSIARWGTKWATCDRSSCCTGP